jgi:hypothetical protein
MKLAAIGACSIQMCRIVVSGRSCSPGFSCGSLDIPEIAAGGIMDGAGIGAVLHRGAAAAQLARPSSQARKPRRMRDIAQRLPVAPRTTRL